MASARFLLNGRLRHAGEVHPTTTLLDYLRLEAGLTGTKEGCAEGDCGACTVMVTDIVDGKPVHRAVNSCLMTVGQADGRAVTTVEGVAGADGALSAVQSALVESDGTQCGFCTPGFIMTMTASRAAGEHLTEDEIHDMLAGNLCRCTGYRPIVEACRATIGTDTDTGREASETAVAPDLEPGEGLTAGEQQFHAPRSSDALAALLRAHPDAWLLAGGTDMGLSFSKRRARPPVVISTAHVAEMRQIAMDDDTLRFGAAATYSELLPALEAGFPDFARLVRRIGSRQIRNLGTIGGNLVTASPIGDTLPCLMALDARVHLRCDGERRSMPVEDFITGYRETALRPGEFIEAVEVSRLGAGETFHAYKISKRPDQDISAVVMGARLAIGDGTVSSIRIFIGGVGPRTLRMTAAEAALSGNPWDAGAVAAARDLIARDVAPMDDFRASAEYRRTVSANLLQRLYLETAGASLCRLEAL